MFQMSESIDIAVGTLNDKVVLKFPHAIEYVELDAQNCMDISEAMASAAFEIKHGLPAAGPALKAELVEKHRMQLTQVIAFNLNSTREDKTISNGRLAQDVVETCLKAVF